MKPFRFFILLACCSLVGGTYVYSQEITDNSAPGMKTFLIEREIPDAGLLSAQQLKEISQKSCSVLQEMGPEIQWLHSYVTEDKIYCLYRAENKEAIMEHASKGGFPANSITELSTQISPETAYLKLE